MPSSAVVMHSSARAAAIAAHNRYQRRYYESRPRRTMQRTDSFYVRHKLSWMTRLAELDRDHEILEVGAGLGKFSLPLLAEGYRLTCLDLSPAMLADLEAAAPAGARLDTLAADILDVGRTTGRRFDRVIGFFALHHFLELEPTFEAISGVLKGGASVTFLEPAASNPLYYLQITLTPGMRWRAERGLLSMRADRVERAMRGAGLVEPTTTSFGFLPPALANTRLGQAVEQRLDDSWLLRPATAFRLFQARRPR